MIVFINKNRKGSILFFKMLIVAVITHYFGIGWGLLLTATINSLPSFTFKLN